MSDLRDLLTMEVLEQGISDMILDDLRDMEEFILIDIHIRKTMSKTYKIYKSNGEELFFNTRYEYEMKDLENGTKLFHFIQAFIHIMRNRNELSNLFVQEIITQIIIYSFKLDYENINYFINEEDVKQYLLLGINDCIEDIINRTQYDNDLRQLYGDYCFNYNYPNDIIVEYSPLEIRRFKNYLQSRNELINIETISIKFYLQHLVYPYSLDYNNFIHYILNEELDRDEDEEDLF